MQFVVSLTLGFLPLALSCLRKNQHTKLVPGLFRVGGDDEIRTHDPLLAGQVLSQLSYTPGSFSFVFSRTWKRRPSPS